MSKNTLSPFSEALQAYGAGKMVIIVDHVDRENEGDLCVATEHVTPEILQFMAEYGRGLVCVSVDTSVAKRLNLPFQVQNNNSPFNTPFTVTVDHKSVAATGVLPKSRAFTMRALLDEYTVVEDFVTPGHVFPLIAHPAGVIGRQGQTEGSYDLARLSGCKPSGVICEILHPDGTMMRGDALFEFAAHHGIPVTSVTEIIRHRVKDEVLVREVAQSSIETDFGRFRTFVFQDDVDSKEHLALVYGDIRSRIPLVRVHSECLTGDVFGSLRCDCGEQLEHAAQMIVAQESGVILYLRQEGRGIGLTNKLKAYALQDTGLDTVEANEHLGFAADERDFKVASSMLRSLGVTKVRLLTNNPDKVETLQDSGLEIIERVPIVVQATEHSKAYLEAKRTKLGHIFQ